jgi:hypothetical protein
LTVQAIFQEGMPGFQTMPVGGNSPDRARATKSADEKGPTLLIPSVV